jgi:ABC-type lipoprotein release transport system permease subunit
LNKVLRQISLEANLTNETPIISYMEAQQVIEFMLNNVLSTVIFFICFLSFILIFSLMQTDVEERRYEFGVLRTLGLRNNSLITLITVQTLFFSIPGIILAIPLTAILKIICDHIEPLKPYGFLIGEIESTKKELRFNIKSQSIN